MKSIKNFLFKKKKKYLNDELDEEFMNFVEKFANYYDYDATELVANINLMLRQILMEGDYDYGVMIRGAEDALETFKKEFEKCQNIAI